MGFSVLFRLILKQINVLWTINTQSREEWVGVYFVNKWYEVTIRSLSFTIEKVSKAPTANFLML